MAATTPPILYLSHRQLPVDSMAGFAATPGMLLASRVPVGIAKQTVTVARAVVADCTPAGQERSSGMSRLVAAFGVGYALGPLLGSWYPFQHCILNFPLTFCVSFLLWCFR